MHANLGVRRGASVVVAAVIVAAVHIARDPASPASTVWPTMTSSPTSYDVSALMPSALAGAHFTRGSAIVGVGDGVTWVSLASELHPHDQARTGPLATIEGMTMSATITAYAVYVAAKRLCRSRHAGP